MLRHAATLLVVLAFVSQSGLAHARGSRRSMSKEAMNILCQSEFNACKADIADDPNDPVKLMKGCIIRRDGCMRYRPPPHR
jgi:hypothetical protein